MRILTYHVCNDSVIIATAEVTDRVGWVGRVSTRPLFGPTIFFDHYVCSYARHLLRSYAAGLPTPGIARGRVLSNYLVFDSAV